MKSAYLELNTERSEVLEPPEMGFERRQALEYHTAVHEHHEVVIESREAAIMNSSGTSFSIQMPSAFKHSNISLRSMFKKFYIKYSF
ncbi:MAG: hypothetical protein ACP5D8_10270 [Fidelibacterota bacterium]